MQLSQEIIEFVLKIVLTVIGAWSAVYFGTRKFYTQKWWEKKAEAYLKIIESLTLYSREHDEYFMALVQNRDAENLMKHSKEYFMRVTSLYYSSELLISKEAKEALRKFIKDVDEIEGGEYHQIGELDEISRLADKCCEEITKLSKKDLKLNTFKFSNPFK